MSLLNQFVLSYSIKASCPKCGHTITISTIGSGSVRCNGCGKHVDYVDGDVKGWH